MTVIPDHSVSFHLTTKDRILTRIQSPIPPKSLPCWLLSNSPKTPQIKRCLRDLMDEGFELPTDCAILTYRDRRRDCLVTQIYPCRAAAEARAEEALRSRKARRGECHVRTLKEAVA